MNYFETDDLVKLAYTDKGSGMAIILIAGYGAPSIGWCSQEKVLVKNGYRVIGFDRRSHGASENPSHGQNMQRQGEDIHELIEHLKLDKCILIGQSQGSSSIFSYLKQYGTEKVLAICGVDQTPKMLNSNDWDYGMYGLNEESRPTFFDTPLGSPNVKKLNAGIVMTVLLKTLKYAKFDMENTKPLLLDHADADWRETIASIDVPALFVAGEKSPFWPKEHAIFCAESCDLGEYAILEGSGHAVNWECPKEFNEIMLQFVNKVLKGR